MEVFDHTRGERKPHHNMDDHQIKGGTRKEMEAIDAIILMAVILALLAIFFA